jgi:hypothetical protein
MRRKGGKLLKISEFDQAAAQPLTEGNYLTSQSAFPY